MDPNIRAGKIVAIFERFIKTRDSAERDELTLEEIRSADEQVGNRDVDRGFRIAMQNRIKELEQNEQRAHESNVRIEQQAHERKIGWKGLIFGVIATILTGVFGTWLTRWLFGT